MTTSTAATGIKAGIRQSAWRPREEDDGSALGGIRVLELAAIIAGAYSGMLLADFGADVIKVEHPNGDPFRHLGNKREGTAVDWKRIGRNKRLVALDLHDPDAQELVRQLAAEADVVTENFRPGRLEEWGLGYDELSRDNPGLVMLRVTGWGQDGPHKDRPGFGSVAEAMAGFAAVNGEKGGHPLLPPFGLADHISGIYGAFSIMTALTESRRSGKGQVIDLAIYECMFSVMGGMALDYDQFGFVQQRSGNRVHYSSPRNVYETSDGRFVALSGSTPNIFRRIMISIERPELVNDPKFIDNTARLKNADELDQLIAGWINTHPFDDVLRVFGANEVALAPVQDISQIFEDEQFIARGAITSVEDEEWGTLRMPGVFPRLSRTPGKIRWAGRKVGQDDNEVFVTR